MVPPRSTTLLVRLPEGRGLERRLDFGSVASFCFSNATTCYKALIEALRRSVLVLDITQSIDIIIEEKKLMRRIVGATVALISMSGVAFAADLNGSDYTEDYYDGPFSFNWSGVYFGVHGGYGWGEWDASPVFKDDKIASQAPDKHPGRSVDLDGFFAGGQLGFNVQTGRFVWGLEGDLSWSDIDGSESWQSEWEGKTTDYTLDTDINWLATLRGRAGLASGPALFYVTGGFAFADVDTSYSIVSGNNYWNKDWSGSKSETKTGWTVGGGLELMLTQNWTMKAEYLYIDLGSIDVALADDACLHESKPRGFDGDLDLHTFKVGFNYRF